MMMHFYGYHGRISVPIWTEDQVMIGKREKQNGEKLLKESASTGKRPGIYFSF